jgi:hypothetical protein
MWSTRDDLPREIDGWISISAPPFARPLSLTRAPCREWTVDDWAILGRRPKSNHWARTLEVENAVNGYGMTSRRNPPTRESRDQSTNKRRRECVFAPLIRSQFSSTRSLFSSHETAQRSLTDTSGGAEKAKVSDSDPQDRQRKKGGGGGGNLWRDVFAAPTLYI